MKPRRICIVTCDIVGPIRNGGIGTAYYSLALALARAGHRVTVLYALGTYCENGRLDEWKKSYATEGIRFVTLPATPVQGHGSLKMADAVYRWLKTHPFDIVHYHEWRGIGAFVAQAKHQGLAFERTLLVAGAHSPTLWHLEGMRELADVEALEVDFLERMSVAHADVLWSPSQHMIDWLRREGWTLPAHIELKPYILLDLESAKGHGAAAGPELVFFGRLETRKGLDVFCDALDRVVQRGLRPARVTFLGKCANVHGTPSEEFLKARAQAWPFKWKIINDLDRDGAMAYLRRPNRVAVLPSRIDNLPYTVLECLGQSIPFVAADTGGIPEMIRPEDRERVLFSLTPESFAARLASVIASGHAPAPLRIPADAILADWLAWHAAAKAPRTVETAHAGRPPLVSVCMTTRNRPAYVKEALRTIVRQDYPAIEVILVDDGSDKPDALAALDALEPTFRRRGWQIVRQPNRYLGAARNAAIARARGTYVMFMDDDNLAEPHEVSTFVHAARTSGADILTCFLGVFQDKKARPTRPLSHIWPFLGPALAPGAQRNVFGDANALFRRDVFDRIGGFTELFGVGCEDWELFARAALSGIRLEVVPEPLVRYRQSPTGMLHTTGRRANQRRALTPYLALLPSELRGLVHLASTHVSHAPVQAAAATAPPVPVLDDVKRAVIFGSGEAGRMAIGLAKKCGWDVGWIVDNNPGMWNQTAHNLPVLAPTSLSDRDFDLVVVASLAGKAAISKQLTAMGLQPGEQFVHFLDPVRVAGVTYQLTLP